MRAETLICSYLLSKVRVEKFLPKVPTYFLTKSSSNYLYKAALSYEAKIVESSRVFAALRRKWRCCEQRKNPDKMRHNAQNIIPASSTDWFMKELHSRVIPNAYSRIRKPFVRIMLHCASLFLFRNGNASRLYDDIMAFGVRSRYLSKLSG